VLLLLARDIPDMVAEIGFITDDMIVERFVPAEGGMGQGPACMAANSARYARRRDIISGNGAERVSQ